jgi:hypothetical protein
MATYFHPKTAELAVPSKEYIKVLNTTAQEVRRILLDESSALIMPESVKTLYDLLFQVILNKKYSVNQILNMRHPTSSRDLRPQTFEGMWRIAFALGVVPGYENVTIYKGKIEEGLRDGKVDRTGTLAYLKTRPIGTSRVDGASDISFSIGDIEDTQQECLTPEIKGPVKERSFGFCSSKYYQNDIKKSVDQYDVTNIISAALAGKYESNEFRVLLLTNNKDAVERMFATAMRRYITYIVKKDDYRRGILGRDDLEAAFTRLRDKVGDHTNPEEFIQKTFGDIKPKPFLTLRFHQELVVRKTLEIKKDKSRSTVLWGVVARGGKTYITGGLIRDLRPKRVFIIAGAYTETHTQFIDDLLDTTKNGFQDFADYTVVDVKNDTIWSPAWDQSKNYIFFMSLELLKLTNTVAKTRTVMRQVINKEIVPDLVFFDEIHKGGVTDLAETAVKLIGESAFKVFMTATYIKPFLNTEYKLDAGNLITWGYEDILTAKTMTSPDTITYFENKYGKEICQEVLQFQNLRGITTTDIALQYQKFPEIQFLTTAFSEEFEASMTRQNILDPNTGFKMSSLFHMGKDCMKITFKKRWECFSSPSTVGLFLNYMGPASVQMDKLPNGSPVMTIKTPSDHITDRIGRTSQRRGDRLKNLEKEFKPHSQLWFLPQASGGVSNDKPLLSMMTCLASLITKHPWFYKNFCVVCVSSGFGTNDEDFMYDDEKGFVKFTNGGNNTKKTVIDAENIARSQGRGLIIIAGRMLTLGVSLPCVNVVALLDDSASSDLTYQKMFRALTESEGKTVGYVVDVNPLRTLKTLYDYCTVEQEQDTSIPNENKTPITAVTLTNLYLIDEDKMFVISENGKRLTADDIHKKLDEYLQASRKVYKTILAEASAKIQNADLVEEYSLLKDVLNRSKPEALGIAQDLAGFDVPSGVENIKDTSIESASPKPSNKKTDKEEEERRRSLREMILTAMTLLAFLTTESELGTAFEKYKKNEDRLQEIIYNTIVDRGLVAKGIDKEDIKNVLLSAISKVMPKLMVPYNSMSAKLSESTGDQKEVLQFIEENLMPKKEQKDSRGEVFTPLELVEEMLNKLPEDVWTHPEYKWLDPANGIGNFPVVAFAKLDVGLAKWEPDEIKRREHIVGNMLYMCEIDATNVELSKKLLMKMCGSLDCKMNLIEGDFLTLTYNEIKNKFGGIEKFNVCMGNPPYNPPKTETGSSGNNLWPNFVMKMETLLEPNGYICVVHPPGWKKPTEDVYKSESENFKIGNYGKVKDRKGIEHRIQIRQGQVWQYLKDHGSFLYVYTNDQKSKTPEFWLNFPAVDYYLFQKDVSSPCKTRNIFCGNEYTSELTLNKELPYLPCLLTQETQDVIQHIITKEGRKPTFQRYRSGKGFSVDATKGSNKYIYTFDKKGTAKYQYSDITHSSISTDKIVMAFDGGIDSYTAVFVPKEEAIGSYEMTMYTVISPEEGKSFETFLRSDIVKFVFLVTQYSSGKMTKNEPLVANSITIPPIDVTDYYEFFGIQQYKPFIEKLLSDYNTFKLPKRKGGDRTSTPRKRSPVRKTIRRILVDDA